MRICKLCKGEKIIAEIIGYCVDCIRDNFEKINKDIYKTHEKIRKNFNLPAKILSDSNGIKCNICGNECIIGENKKGYCGLRENKDGKISGPVDSGNLSYYYDKLPTNCVAELVCNI